MNRMLLPVLLVTACTGVVAQVTAIAPDGHPNLFFNQQEIDALRQAVLVDQAPAYAVDTYNRIKHTAPAGMPSNLPSLPWPDDYAAGRYATLANMKACFSYMIEPTPSKADALRSALLSWTNEPSRTWADDVQSAGHAHFAIAWMYDLIYSAGVLSDSDKTSIDDFFGDISRVVAFDNAGWIEAAGATANAEGSYRETYQNWWQFDFHAGVVSALVSHDQSAVDRVFSTNVPDDYFLQDISQYEPSTRDLKNMINGLVYPSGRNFDGYFRDYNNAGEHYHYFALLPSVLGAEAAWHNGFDAWSYAGNALLRSIRTGVSWAGSARRGSSTYNWMPFIWVAYRHFPNDPVIQSAVSDSRAMSALPWVFDSTLPLWGAIGEIMPPTVAVPAPPQDLRTE